MARTLQQLKESIETLIKHQGQHAPVAAFIFTQEDVYTNDVEGNPIFVPLDIAEKVLDSIESEYDHLYEEIFDCIDNELRTLEVEDP